MTRALLQRARDLIQDAMDTHIYNEQDGEVPDADCQYAELVRDLDAALVAKSEPLHSLNERELAAVLTGLRMLQEMGASPSRFYDILTDSGSFEPLDADEIDSLCESLNFNSR